MKQFSFFFCLFFMVTSLRATANRAMYVDGFASILGDIAQEDALLAYAQTHEIETLLLYELHIVHANHNLPNATTNQVLADFIYKAKTSYGITEMGATAENSDFFTNVIDAYNNSRTEPLEKFDIYNLEFEYWISSATNAGGYYCTTYLSPNGLPCTEQGAFEYFVSILETMNTLADNNVHPITTEAYVGWTSTAQAAIIATKLDKLRLHAYVSSPTTAFGYADDRLIDFANGNPGLDVSIIYSAEPAFMQTWLESNSMLAAENTFTTDWVSGSTSWANNINLDGFTYFAFGFMPNIVLPIELSYFRGQATSEGVVLNWATAAEINASHFVIEHQDPISKEFKTIGTTQAQGQSESTITYAFTDSKPHNKLNYYRLKQIDLDGNFDYSNAISVAIEAQPYYRSKCDTY